MTMHHTRQIKPRFLLLSLLLIGLIVAATRLRADTGSCGGASITSPFTDVPATNIFFCAIASAFFSGLTNGTSATTYSPGDFVTREQMAAFITRTHDSSLRRGSRRAALRQWWTPQNYTEVGVTTVGISPVAVESDGADLWVANRDAYTVSRVRASDGKLLETWTGADSAHGVLAARGDIYVTGSTSPGRLYRIDPTAPAGNVAIVTSNLGDQPRGIAYDGNRIWTANSGGSVSCIRFSFICNPVCVTTVTAGFSVPRGMLYDGAHIWVTDEGDHKLKKLDERGNILGTPIAVGFSPGFPVFDGVNLWVPSASDSVTVVRVKDVAGNPLTTPFVLATLTGNGLDGPVTAAFDGERMLVTNQLGNRVSLWKAADLTPLGTASLLPLGGQGTAPTGACSDGLNFWVTLRSTAKLVRF
jgi:hypothetical protein